MRSQSLEKLLDNHHLRIHLQRLLNAIQKSEYFEEYEDDVIENALKRFTADNVVPIFREHLQSLPAPHVITAEELAEDFYRDVLRFFFVVKINFEGFFEKLFEPIFETFKSTALGRIRLRSSSPIKCFTGTARNPFTSDSETIKAKCWLWNYVEHRKFEEIRIPTIVWTVEQSGVLPSAHLYDIDDDTEHVDVFATIEGFCSERAMQNMTNDLRGILRVIYECHSVIYGSRYREAHEKWFSALIDSIPITLNDFPPAEAAPQENRKNQDEQPEDISLRQASQAWDQHKNTFQQNARELLEAFINPPKKDHLLKRLRIALKLLAKAREESDHGLSLALYVGAMEALLSKKGSNVSQMFADIVARLLEPNTKQRAEAVRYVLDMYELRSAVLHGADDKADSGKRNEAQYLAYAVLTAYAERLMMRKRLGESPEKPDDLMKELKEDRFSDGLPFGVQESPVVKLWRTDGGKVETKPE